MIHPQRPQTTTPATAHAEARQIAQQDAYFDFFGWCNQWMLPHVARADTAIHALRSRFRLLGKVEGIVYMQAYLAQWEEYLAEPSTERDIEAAERDLYEAYKARYEGKPAADPPARLNRPRPGDPENATITDKG